MLIPKLYNGADASAWHARRWPEFEPPAPRVPVVQPVYALADWGLGYPFDAEEVIGSAVLDRALELPGPESRPLVLPPLRHTPDQGPNCAFTLDIEVAHHALAEIIRSVAASGFQRCILFNTSPFLEEWIDVAARDLRVTDDLQLFCVNLSGLGLDFHPTRPETRAGLSSLLAYFLGEAPEGADAARAVAADPIPGAAVRTAEALGEDPAGAAEILEKTGTRLAGLFAEIETHPPLPRQKPDKEASE